VDERSREDERLLGGFPDDGSLSPSTRFDEFHAQHLVDEDDGSPPRPRPRARASASSPSPPPPPPSSSSSRAAEDDAETSPLSPRSLPRPRAEGLSDSSSHVTRRRPRDASSPPPRSRRPMPRSCSSAYDPMTLTS
jgi:hypothetical protein